MYKNKPFEAPPQILLERYLHRSIWWQQRFWCSLLQFSESFYLRFFQGLFFRIEWQQMSTLVLRIKRSWFFNEIVETEYLRGVRSTICIAKTICWKCICQRQKHLYLIYSRQYLALISFETQKIDNANYTIFIHRFGFFLINDQQTDNLLYFPTNRPPEEKRR